MFFRKTIDRIDIYPFMSCHIRRRDKSIPFGKLCEIFITCFKRSGYRVAIGVNNHIHLSSNTITQMCFPLNLFGCMWKFFTNLLNVFNKHNQVFISFGNLLHLHLFVFIRVNSCATFVLIASLFALIRVQKLMIRKYSSHGPISSLYCLAITLVICERWVRSCITQVAIN